MCFVDLEKALDRAQWKVLEWSLRKKGTPEVLVRSVMSLYEEADLIFGKNCSIPCAHKVKNIKTTVLASDHRSLSIDYRLRWPTRKNLMASEIDW